MLSIKNAVIKEYHDTQGRLRLTHLPNLLYHYLPQATREEREAFVREWSPYAGRVLRELQENDKNVE